MGYCELTDIEALIQLDLTTDTQPTTAQVEIFIGFKSSEMDIALSNIGVSIPVTDTNFLNLLKKYCGYGVAGLTLLARGKNNPTTEEGSKANYFLDEYSNFIHNIKNHIPRSLLGLNITIGNQITDGFASEPDFESNATDRVKF